MPRLFSRSLFAALLACAVLVFPQNEAAAQRKKTPSREVVVEPQFQMADVLSSAGQMRAAMDRLAADWARTKGKLRRKDYTRFVFWDSFTMSDRGYAIDMQALRLLLATQLQAGPEDQWWLSLSSPDRRGGQDVIITSTVRAAREVEFPELREGQAQLFVHHWWMFVRGDPKTIVAEAKNPLRPITPLVRAPQRAP